MDLTELQDRLSRLWTDRSPAERASRAAAALFDTPGDWDPPADIAPRDDLLYLSVGIPDTQTLPIDAIRAAAERVLTRGDEAAYRYGFGTGYFPLRRYLAERRSLEEGADVSPDTFQVTNGSSGAIDLVVRSLVDPGDVILTECPTYMGTLHAFRGAQARIEPVRMDEEGLDTDALAERLDRLRSEGARVKLVYTISAFHNPSGRTLSLARRVALLELAARHDLLVLDDEAYRGLWYDEPAPPTLAQLSGGHGVITVGSFSKILATGLRIGWIHAPEPFIRLFGRMRFAMGQNQLALRVVAELASSGAIEPHVDAMRALYRGKMHRISDALRKHAGEWLTFEEPAGGFYLWARLRDGLSARDVWRTGYAEGVAVNPGDGFAMAGHAEGLGGEYLRVAYSWADPDRLEEAARRLATACRRVADGHSA
ncbi:MAG: PLP-dependent aminotransferase family protein [Deltaproteobacteria bacterium]|nr:PLP-dependent aminotransferase family protein [Deltaproteobacteria bacterium]